MFLVFRQGGQRELAMFRKFAITALGAATLLTAPLPALAMSFGNGLPVVKSESIQLVDHRRYRRKWRRRGSYQYYRHRRHSNGAAAVAAIIGLGTILAIANSNNRRNAYYDDGYYGDAPVYGYQPGSPEWIAACARKYRSFEPRTGLYTTYNGYKRRCRLP
jgi:hypothetical protein